MIVEITTFRLAASADATAFLAADRHLQTDLLYNQPGFLRRTTARQGDEWLVVVLWASQADASTFDAVSKNDPVQAAFEQLIDSASLTTRRYETLD